MTDREECVRSRRWVLLDTDIGTNIDDAVCLAYLLCQPECLLLGVSMATVGAERHLELVRTVCAAAGQAPDVARSGAEAATMMRRHVLARPGQVELLSIGPLTNVALLLESETGAAGTLAGLTMMCGTFDRGAPGPESPERNARSDPEATAKVYAAPLRRCRSVGLNVTRQVTADRTEVRALLSQPAFAPLRPMVDAWFAAPARGAGPGAERSETALNDPLAAVSMFEPGACAFERGTVEVAAGATVWHPGGPGAPHEIAITVDPVVVERHLRRVMVGSGEAPSGEGT
ncbi:MAG: nucleoside hydrolase [Anaerolineae bacterium]